MRDIPRYRYATIVVDPPSRFATWSGKGRGRSAERHYRTMSDDELAALPIWQLAQDDAFLFFWTSGPYLERHLRIMRNWGFTFSTLALIWVKLDAQGKPSLGLGYLTRSGGELLLAARKGHPKRLAANVAQVLLSSRLRHSEKPQEALERIERLCSGPYLELFARSARSGWDSFGDEVSESAEATPVSP